MIDIKMTSARAVLGFVLPFAVVLTMVLSGIDIFIALIAALAVLVIYGMILGAKLKDMEKAMANGASAVIGAVLVVILVGGLIGVWMACGSVPAMLYYGIKLINPQMFLPLAFIICSGYRCLLGHSGHRGCGAHRRGRGHWCPPAFGRRRYYFRLPLRR